MTYVTTLHHLVKGKLIGKPEYAIICTNSQVCFPKDGRMWREIYVFV
jgi:hypothetical protein